MYLSVDMDYWFNQYSSYDYFNRYSLEDGNENSFYKFMQKVFDLNVPVFFCEEHHNILEDLNKIRVDKVYNIDFHSDIVYEDVSHILDEGSWANYYIHRNFCEFEWRYPDKFECVTEGYGLCHTLYNSRATQRSRMGYNKVIFREGLHRIDWGSITNVGLCLSENWCVDGTYEIWDNLRSKYENNKKRCNKDY